MSSFHPHVGRLLLTLGAPSVTDRHALTCFVEGEADALVLRGSCRGLRRGLLVFGMLARGSGMLEFLRVEWGDRGVRHMLLSTLFPLF
jgi:hypothetical protein